MRKKARESRELSLVVSASAICTEREAPPEVGMTQAQLALEVVVSRAAEAALSRVLA